MSILEHINNVSALSSSVFILIFFFSLLSKMIIQFHFLKKSTHSYISTNYHNKFLMIAYMCNLVFYLTKKDLEASDILMSGFYALLFVIMFIVNRFLNRKSLESQEILVRRVLQRNQDIKLG